jgi:hypothetical protein
MKPARSLVSAAATGHGTNLLIDIVDPLAGALVGVAIYEARREPAGRALGPAAAQLPVIVEQALKAK